MPSLKCQRVNVALCVAEPYFVIPLEDQILDVGTERRLRCEADGRPTPAYRWLKDAEPLTNGTKDIKVTSQGQQSALTP